MIKENTEENNGNNMDNGHNNIEGISIDWSDLIKQAHHIL